MFPFDAKNLKSKFVSKWHKVFHKKQDEDPKDSGTYFDLPSQTTVEHVTGEYDVLPPGVRPVLPHRPVGQLAPPPETPTEREWFKQDTSPDIWDTEQTIDLIVDGLIESDDAQEKVTPVSLVGEYDPKNFLSQVPNTDTAGNELPPWKRMLMAKQIAEKEFQIANEKKQQEEDEEKYRDMPVWKKAILLKKENERNPAVEDQ